MSKFTFKDSFRSNSIHSRYKFLMETVLVNLYGCGEAEFPADDVEVTSPWLICKYYTNSHPHSH
jgi:hypothetical protein